MYHATQPTTMADIEHAAKQALTQKIDNLTDADPASTNELHRLQREYEAWTILGKLLEGWSIEAHRFGREGWALRNPYGGDRCFLVTYGNHSGTYRANVATWIGNDAQSFSLEDVPVAFQYWKDLEQLLWALLSSGLKFETKASHVVVFNSTTGTRPEMHSTREIVDTYIVSDNILPPPGMMLPIGQMIVQSGCYETGLQLANGPYFHELGQIKIHLDRKGSTEPFPLLRYITETQQIITYEVWTKGTFPDLAASTTVGSLPPQETEYFRIQDWLIEHGFEHNAYE